MVLPDRIAIVSDCASIGLAVELRPLSSRKLLRYSVTVGIFIGGEARIGGFFMTKPTWVDVFCRSDFRFFPSVSDALFPRPSSFFSFNLLVSTSPFSLSPTTSRTVLSPSLLPSSLFTFPPTTTFSSSLVSLSILPFSLPPSLFSISFSFPPSFPVATPPSISSLFLVSIKSSKGLLVSCGAVTLTTISSWPLNTTLPLSFPSSITSLPNSSLVPATAAFPFSPSSPSITSFVRSLSTSFLVSSFPPSLPICFLVSFFPSPLPSSLLSTVSLIIHSSLTTTLSPSVFTPAFPPSIPPSFPSTTTTTTGADSFSPSTSLTSSCILTSFLILSSTTTTTPSLSNSFSIPSPFSSNLIFASPFFSSFSTTTSSPSFPFIFSFLSFFLTISFLSFHPSSPISPSSPSSLVLFRLFSPTTPSSPSLGFGIRIGIPTPSLSVFIPSVFFKSVFIFSATMHVCAIKPLICSL
eukprot:comp20554_c0_seq1/m.26388 comp20554_c0_seq1/g.26388  ORF comp20554_c0_seq1/g.26388 comp20554_c0_seq1/m.26388 type:complete len:465 (+) comp20554_c0_seq1:2598-3992(+)